MTALFGGRGMRVALRATLLGALAALAVACGSQPAPTAAPAPTSTLTPTPIILSTATPAPTPTFAPTPVILPTVAVPTPAPTPEPSGSLAEMLDEIERRVSEMREIYAFVDVDREFIAKDELRSRLLDDFEEDRDEVLQAQELYATLGILDEDVNLIELLVELYSEAVLGFFDTDENKMYIVNDDTDFSPADALTYAHEYAHGLQHRNFDLKAAFDAMEESDEDGSLAYRALVEGDASLVEALYRAQQLSEEEQAQAQEESASQSYDAFLAAPHVIRELVVFPYVHGPRFVVDLLLESNSWKLVNQAFERVPLSTEHILHSEKYLAYEEPVEVVLPDVQAALGEEWRKLDEDTLGEFILMSYLEMELEPEEAAAAAAGWGGDRYVLLQNVEGERLLISRVTWDSEADASEFFDAFQALMSARSDGEWRAIEGDDSTRTIDLANQSLLLSIDSADTLIIFAPDAGALEAAQTALAGLL